MHNDNLWKKVSQICELLPRFSKKLPKVNSHPMGENSSNPITLLALGI
jgi:hypothetical protein